MKAVFKYILHTVLLLPLLLTGCYDDTFDDFRNPGEYPEGETLVQMRVDFMPFSTQEVGTRAQNGAMLDSINDLCVVAFDNEGKLMEGFPIEITKAHELQIVKQPRKDSDASSGKKDDDDKETYQATFKLKVPYGRYYIYGVANLGYCDKNGNRVKKTIDELSAGGKYFDAMQKGREEFLKVQTGFDENNYRNNGEMLGFFTDGEKSSPGTSKEMNDRTVDVNRPNMTLHSWLRRCAAKVTIDFDGSGLNDKVTIYIRRATIHDIPTSCAIGKPNSPQSMDLLYTHKKADYRPDELGDHIDFGDGANYEGWPRITKQTPYIVDKDGTRKSLHDYNSPSLFLYENMQYDGTEDKNFKEQQVDGNGYVIGTDKKDSMPYGSYIEVEAYYVRQLLNNEKSEGKLIYRFMLGKDTKLNFDVERNYHYKLTLCPRGYGNDVDWHIEYLENDNFEYKDPYYVSYLYNHDSTLRFRYQPPEGVTVDSIYAEIVGNNWWPDDEKANYYPTAKNNQDALDNSDPFKAKFEKNRYTDANGKSRTRYLGNGFLSLRATDTTVIRQAMTSDFVGEAWEADGFHQAKNPMGKYMNDNYFYGFEPKRTGDKKDWTYKKDSKLIDRSRRTYYFSGKTDETNKEREKYECQLRPDGAYMFNLPMYTRAKNLVKATGYTGNNPYEGAYRTAYVRVTVYLSNGGTRQQVLRVKQVPRITNPKGIYRRSGNNENFHVVLTERDGDEGAKFNALQSDGPWMAEVITNDANFINLNGRSTIKGSGGQVSFNVRFNKMNRDDQVRNACIRVRYHNYSCVHLIFVRQGYSSQALESSNTEWHTNNLVYDGVDANGLDPRDEGSLFKFGNLTDPIDAHCNEFPGVTPGMYPTWDQFKPRNSGKYDIARRNLTYAADSLTWDEIKHYSSGFSDASGVATMKDFERLYRNKNVEQAFGVLYADGATTTQMTVSNAYGYNRYDSDDVRETKGMCGVFIYYWDKSNYSEYNSRNVFFPIGRAGYGHRKAGAREPNGAGTQRYACANRANTYPSSLLDWEPLFYDLSRRKGAVYYARRVDDNIYNVNGIIEAGAMALDLNFFTFDVNLITQANLNNGADACFLRRVGAQTRGKDEVKKSRAKRTRLRR